MTAIPTASDNNDPPLSLSLTFSLSLSLSSHTHTRTHFVACFMFTFHVRLVHTNCGCSPNCGYSKSPPRHPRCATTTNPELIVACLPSNVRAQCSPSRSFVVSSIALCFRRLARAMLAGTISVLEFRARRIQSQGGIVFYNLRPKLNKSRCIKAQTLIVSEKLNSVKLY